MSRKERRKGLTSIEDCMDATFRRLEEYTEKSKERLITAASNNNIKKKIEEIAHEMMWTWLRNILIILHQLKLFVNEYRAITKPENQH